MIPEIDKQDLYLSLQNCLVWINANLTTIQNTPLNELKLQFQSLTNSIFDILESPNIEEIIAINNLLQGILREIQHNESENYFQIPKKLKILPNDQKEKVQAEVLSTYNTILQILNVTESSSEA